MLKSSTITLTYAVAFLDLFSASMITNCLPNYLKSELGMSATYAGVVSSIYGSVQFFSCPLVGGLSDRRGYRSIMLICLLLCVPAYLLLISPSWTLVVFSRIAAGCFKHTQNLSRTFLASCASENDKIRAYGRLNAMGNVGFIAGPMLSAWLLANYNYAAVYVCVSLTFLLNAMLIYLFLDSSDSEQANNNNSKISSSSGDKKKINYGLLHDLMSINWTRHWDLFATRFLLSFTVLLYRNSYNYVMSDKFQVTVVMQNYLSSYQGLISFLASYYCNIICKYYNNDAMKLYESSIILMFVSIVGLMLAPSFGLLAVSLAPLCFSTAVMRVVSLQLTTERCHANDDLGLIMGASASVTSVARSVSPALGGALYDFHPDLPATFGVLLTAISYGITVRHSRFKRT